ncbi:glycosyltransferase family 2 protein [Jannaschia sp. LMIT008]|uniref:glycosyltransferase family 2 protein n=1 Tax=Jannaschia maritima TaxID=3032585 RepID=UPI002810EA67|nr:glycosyltransferase [Jannaschia sp. LMIT008]
MDDQTQATSTPEATTPAAERCTVIVTQRERFGMTAESLDSLFEHTPGVRLVYVDGNSPDRWRTYLAEQAEARGFTLVRTDHFLTPNQARNIGVRHAETEFVAFCDNDVIYSDGWLDRLIACADEEGADVVAPLTCQGLPAHTEIHHAGGDYAAGGDMAGFFAGNPDLGRAFDEVMHGHGDKVADWQGKLTRQETGMSEFHCALTRRDVFDRIGPLDEGMLSTKEHIDFCMMVKAAGGSVWFEPSSVVTYVFPCRARPMSPEDWPFFSLRWSNAYGLRSLNHFIAKWNLSVPDGYVARKRQIYVLRRLQGILTPMMFRVPGLRAKPSLAKRAARVTMFPERIVNRILVERQDRRARKVGAAPVMGPPPMASRGHADA